MPTAAHAHTPASAASGGDAKRDPMAVSCVRACVQPFCGVCVSGREDTPPPGPRALRNNGEEKRPTQTAAAFSAAARCFLPPSLLLAPCTMAQTLPRAALEDLVKASQRDAQLKERWHAHVDAAGGAHADPARAPASLLRSFADALVTEKRGARLVAAVAPAEAPPSASAPPPPHSPAPGAADAAAIEALVRATAAHPRYSELYIRPITADAGWVAAPSVAAPPGDAATLAGAHPPLLLALDCEMVETDASSTDVVRVALVSVRWRAAGGGGDGDGAAGDAGAAVTTTAGAAAIDTVLSAAVRPKATVTNWRPAITGLGPGALAAAPFTRRGAAKAVAAALSAAAAAAATTGAPPPVLIGHALHHDVAALQLALGRAPRVIDTALCFGWEGLPNAAPALADLHAAVVGGAPLRAAGAAHCCEKDAAAAAVLALAAASAAGVPSLAAAPVCATTGRRLLPPPKVQLTRDELSRLLIHGMPAGMTPVDAVAALSAVAPTALASTLSVADAGGPSKTFLVFSTPGDADAAFAALVEAAGGRAGVTTDSLGRQQVCVSVGGGSARVRVRRAGAHGGLSHGVDSAVKKRDRTAAEVAHGKRLRAGGGGGG